MTHTQLLIIGSGPAGYTAAIYASRSGIETTLIEGLLVGGQLTQTTIIENYPGLPEGTSASTLMTDMRAQAERFGARFVSDVVTELRTDERPFVVQTESSETYTSDSVIVATGASPRKLGAIGEETFAGRGVSYCATCDGFFFRGKDVAVVGGGDTACQEALYLATLARHVYIIVRRSEMRASASMQEQVLKNDKITILTGKQVAEINGALTVSDLTLVDSLTATKSNLQVSGLFVAVGHTPNSSSFPTLTKDSEGYIVVDPLTQKTNIEGVYACGDVADPYYRQAITAAASGAKAAMAIKENI